MAVAKVSRHRPQLNNPLANASTTAFAPLRDGFLYFRERLGHRESFGNRHLLKPRNRTGGDYPRPEPVEAGKDSLSGTLRFSSTPSEEKAGSFNR